MARTFLVTLTTYLVVQGEVEVEVEGYDDDDIAAFDLAEQIAIGRSARGGVEWDWQSAHVDGLADTSVEDVQEL